LDANDEFVAGDILEDTLCDVFELNPDLHLGLVQGYIGVFSRGSSYERRTGHTFTSFEDEGYTFPARIVDPKCGSSKGWANRVRRDSVIVEVARLSIRRNILAQQAVISLNRRNSTEHLDLSESKCD